MDETQLYAARIELIDYVIEALHDVPTEDFLETLLSGEIRLPEDPVNDQLDEGFSLLRSFIEENRGGSVEATCDRLEREYTRVFVGPRPPVLAHETYYRDDTQFIGKGLAVVEASYSAAGWNPPENYPEENDFIAIELAFLRHLLDQQRQGKDEAVGYERVFLDEHLLEWTEPFVEDVIENTEEPFYLAAAHVFGGLVEFEDEIVAAQMARS